MCFARVALLVGLLLAGVAAGCARRPMIVDRPQQKPSELEFLFPTPSEIPYLLCPYRPRSVPPDKFAIYLGLRHPRYQSYDVVEIMYLSYYRRSPEPLLPVVDMEVVRFGSPDDAFGVFSLERPVITEETKLHDRGYISSANAGFWSRDLYIRILAPTDDPSNVRWLRSVAGLVLERLPPGPALPPGFDRLPLALRVPNSEIFIRQQVLRYPFLSNGYLADYDFGGRMATAFVCACAAPEVAQQRFRTFFEAVVNQNVRTAPAASLGDRAFLARGTRHGNIVIFQRDRFLAGLLAAPPDVGDFLQKFDALLRNSEQPSR